jgi:hypothetical protein
MANRSPNIRTTHATAAEIPIWVFPITDFHGQALDLPWAIALSASESAARLAAAKVIPQGTQLGKGEQAPEPAARDWRKRLADGGVQAQLVGEAERGGYNIVSSGS